MWDNIVLALQSLRAGKLRALLTMLGIIIGIGSVITIETVGASLSGSITDSMSGFGISNITVSLTQKTEDDSSGSNVRLRMFKNAAPEPKDLITEEMLAEYRSAFAEKVSAIEITQSAGTASTVAADGNIVSAILTGINNEYLDAEQIPLLYGRGIRNENDNARKVCVVSDRFVTDALGIRPINAVGQSVQMTLNGMPVTFYIQGVYAYDEEDTGFSMVSADGDDSVTTTVYLPLDTARQLAGSTDAGVQSFIVVAAAGVDTTAFLDNTQRYFETYYTRNDTWTVQASSMESLVSTITQMLDTVSLAISAIAAISLLVGGIGVMNIMLVSVTERTREIGIRKALGAPRSAIRTQFVVEAVVICLVGGLFGILLGLGLGAAASSMLGFAAKPNPQAIALAVGFSMVIGVFFGYYPADKAARLDPIEALRYE